MDEHPSVPNARPEQHHTMTAAELLALIHDEVRPTLATTLDKIHRVEAACRDRLLQRDLSDSAQDGVAGLRFFVEKALAQVPRIAARG